MRTWIKLAAVLALTLALLIPLALVRNVIHERQRYRAEAIADVVRTYAGPQAIAGPVLTVPYTEWARVHERNAAGTMHSARRRVTRQWTFFPTQLRITGRLTPTVRRRGLHEVPLYRWRGDVHADFDVALPDDAAPDAQREVGAPVLSYAITDVRGIRGTPRLQVEGRALALREGHGVRDSSGLHAQLSMPDIASRLRFGTHLALELAGAESLAIVPLGARNEVHLASSWPHPSFQGRSPADSRVGREGFSARWQLASVATDAQREYLAGRVPQTLPDRGGRALDAFGVVLADPVDAYAQADRATKYGLLFVLLTFLGFFMFELIRALPIHPLQYGLVGLAIAIFFLLLVSLSEHIAFGAAYAIAAFACIGLIAFYLSAVLRSAARGLGFGTMLALLYAARYGLLVSEDNALVLGAGLLFVILAAVMVATRRVDWYRVAAAGPA